MEKLTLIELSKQECKPSAKRMIIPLSYGKAKLHIDEIKCGANPF
jgi:hypothetical protein